MHLAAQLLYTVVAHLLAHYTFGKAVDPNTGEEIPVHFKDYTGNAIGRCGAFLTSYYHCFHSLVYAADAFSFLLRSQPKPFVCSIKPRDAQHAEIIRREWKEYVDQGLADA